MNTLIDGANGWAGRVAETAVSVFWQSSLLIVIVGLFDLALRKRLRASVRYAVWLVVLVKFVMPPSLAIPCGAGWWMREQTIVRQVPKNVKVSVGAAAVGSSLSAAPPAAVAQESPKIAMQTWVILSSAGISLGLFGWMIVRWRQVSALVGRGGEAAGSLQRILEEAQTTAGIRTTISLRLTEHPISPAVCGLFKPAILLPRTLVAQLSDQQMRSVLVHELIHVRRCDIWVNWVQALLQIVFWWHPLLWMANARIRQLREEAVDDAVIIALRDGAEDYAPALLDVAKLALDRPLATLALVGILESRSALRQRIERLVNHRTPRRAGLTILSAVGVAGFALVALPMGPAPGGTADGNVREYPPGTNGQVAVRVYSPRVELGATNPMPGNSNLVQVKGVKTIGTNVIPYRVVSSAPVAGSLAEGKPAIKIFVNLVELGDFDPLTTAEGSPFRILPRDAVTHSGGETSRIVNGLRARFDQPQNLRLEYFASDNLAMSLTWGQYTNFMRESEAHAGTDILSPPPAVTADGRVSALAVNDVITVVTGVLTNEQVAGYDGKPIANYQTEAIEFGPVVELNPRIEADGHTIHLSISAHILGFMGYEGREDPTNVVVIKEAGPGGQKRLTAVRPLPRIRVTEVTGEGSVPDGHALMVAGPVYYDDIKMIDKVPILGDLPGVGKLFKRQSTGKSKKTLVILATPTLVNADGEPFYKK